MHALVAVNLVGISTGKVIKPIGYMELVIPEAFLRQPPGNWNCDRIDSVEGAFGL
jgi:hypothetical protein